VRHLRPDRSLHLTGGRKGEDRRGALGEQLVVGEGERVTEAWDRIVIGVAALFHLAFALVLVALPYDQLLTEGTAPIFALAPPRTWSIFYALAGAGIAVILLWCRPAVHALVWVYVAALFGAWLVPLAAAVLHGGGSPVGLLVITTLYLLFGFAAVAHALKR
jgi:hypothetical protein